MPSIVTRRFACLLALLACTGLCACQTSRAPLNTVAVCPAEVPTTISVPPPATNRISAMGHNAGHYAKAWSRPQLDFVMRPHAEIFPYEPFLDLVLLLGAAGSAAGGSLSGAVLGVVSVPFADSPDAAAWASRLHEQLTAQAGAAQLAQVLVERTTSDSELPGFRFASCAAAHEPLQAGTQGVLELTLKRVALVGPDDRRRLELGVAARFVPVGPVKWHEPEQVKMSASWVGRRAPLAEWADPAGHLLQEQLQEGFCRIAQRVVARYFHPGDWRNSEDFFPRYSGLVDCAPAEVEQSP